MELSAEEAKIFDEITIEPAEKKKVRIPVLNKQQPVIEDAGVEAFMNANKAIPQVVQEDQPFMGDGEEYEDDGAEQYAQAQVPSEGYKTIEDEKGDLLNKIARLQKRGFLIGKRFGPHTDIEELRTEFKRTMYSIQCDQSVKFQRRILLACVTGIEFLNKRYDPFDVYLDGWSENMMESIEDYDPVFEELYAKYKDKVAVAPEIKLIMMVGGSAMMFHLTHSMFKAAIPNMSDVMKKNPDLMKSMMDAVTGAASQAPPSDGRREMRGPGIDLSSLFPMGQQPPKIPEEDEVSDIVSVTSEGGTKDVAISGEKKKRGRSKKTEVTI